MRDSLKVLVVEDDLSVRRAMCRLFEADYDVLEAGTIAAALELLEAHEDIYALVLDLVLPDGGGLDLLRALSERGWEIPSVVVSGHLSPTTFQAAMDLGAVRVLEKGSTDNDALREAVALALECGHGTRGSLHGLSLIDVLQMFHYARRNVSVNILGGHPGMVVMEGGEIVHAEVAELTGVEALQSLLARSQASIRTSAISEGFEPTITGAFEGLLLDCLRLVDEQGQTEASASLMPSFYPLSTEPPALPKSISNWSEEGAIQRLGPVLEGTILRLCPGSSAVYLEEGSSPTWLRHRPADGGDDELFSEFMASAMAPSWVWMLRTSPTVVVGCLRVPPDGIALCVTPSLSASTQGQMLAGLRAAQAQLEAMNPKPHEPPVAAEDPPPPAHDTPEDVESATRALTKALQSRGARGIRVSPAGQRDCWVAAGEALDANGPLSHSQWSLAANLLGGALGREVRDSAVISHGLSQLDAIELESEVLLSTESRYLFGRVLPQSSCHLLISCEKIPTIIGPMTSSIRRHRNVHQLDELLASLAS